MLKFNQYLSESGLCAACEADPCICDDSHGFVAEAVDKGEYDYEGQMARTQLQTTMRNCRDMIAMLKDDDNMPEWVQSKITLAQDYITSVRDYLQSKEELGEEVVTESLDTHEMAMAHKDKASKALETSDMKSYHAHMSNHHESMGQWHESKGRHSAADREYTKAEEHHEKSLKPDNSRTVGAKNESTIKEATSAAVRMQKALEKIKADRERKERLAEPYVAVKSVFKKPVKESLSESKHKVSVTVSEKDHPMVSKRLEKQQKRVVVTADSKDEAVARAKKFYSKQGYHVHDAEYHSAAPVKEEKVDEVIAGNLSCMSCGDTACQCDSHTQMVETGKKKSFKQFINNTKK